MAKKVNITWVDSNPVTDLDHFEIWRRLGLGGTYEKISPNIALGVQAYEDTNSGQGLTQGETYYYQVRAYNGENGYSSVESSVAITGDSLYEDDFAGTVIDTAKWGIVNTDSSVLPITQNDNLIFTHLSTTNTPAFDNHIYSKSTWQPSVFTELEVDVAMDDPDNRHIFGLSADANVADNSNVIFVQGTTTAGDVIVNVKTDGTSDSSTVQVDFTTVKRFKITVINSDVTFYVSSNDGIDYSQLFTTTHSYSSNFQIFLGALNSGGANGKSTYNNLIAR